MAQWRKSFYELGRENIADPAVAEQQRNRQLAMQQQQIGMERQAQQAAMVQAQQEMALKAMLAQQSQGLARERMAQEQARFEAQQAGYGDMRAHEMALEQLRQQGRAAAAEKAFGRQTELARTKRDWGLDLAKTKRGWAKEDQLGVERREEKRYGKRTAEADKKFERRLAEKIRRETEAERREIRRGRASEEERKRLHKERMEAIAADRANREARNELQNKRYEAGVEAAEREREAVKAELFQSDRMALQNDLEAIRSEGTLETQAKMAEKLRRKAAAGGQEIADYVDRELLAIQAARKKGLFQRTLEGMFGKNMIGDYEVQPYPLIPESRDAAVLREALKSVRDR